MAKSNHQAALLGEKRARQQRIEYSFPKNTLEDAIRVPQAIEDANGGQPYPPTETALAMNLSPGQDEFRNLLSSSLRYGLTKGSFISQRISIEALGRSIVQPQSPEEVRKSLVKAALTPKVFDAMYAYYRGKKLPDTKFLQNTVVREFQVPKEHAELCANNFVANMEFVGLVRTGAGGRWFGTDALTASPTSISAPEPAADMADDGGEAEMTEKETPTETPKAPAIANPPAKNAIFVGHGKNKVPLEQLRSVLNQFGIPHKVAIHEANVFRPISQKVAEIMQSCGAGILIFTADEEFHDKDGNTIWRPSENVVFELGAASVLYDQKVIIFKEKSVTFPSNFKDIGYIEFDKDALTSKSNELFTELIAFGLIKVLVGS
jgi:predicted nucleotide-binding protein